MVFEQQETDEKYYCQPLQSQGQKEVNGDVIPGLVRPLAIEIVMTPLLTREKRL